MENDKVLRYKDSSWQAVLIESFFVCSSYKAFSTFSYVLSPFVVVDIVVVECPSYLVNNSCEGSNRTN